MSILNKFKKSEYAKNSTILMAGTVISMVLQTLSVFWLGKFYADDMWGIYEYFCTAYSIFLIVATGRYELAIMLPKEDSDGFMIALLSAGLSVAFSIVASIILFILYLFGIELGWIIFLPLTLAILGVYYSCNYWLNRKKRYINLAINRVIQGVLFVVFNLGYAFILSDIRYGLILGYISAQGIVMVMLIVSMIVDYKKKKFKLSFKRIKELAKEYINFPKISSISGVINNVAVRLPVLLLGLFAGNAVVGQYAMMSRILGAPITVISEAIRDVFRQKASKEYALNRECCGTFMGTFKSLALIAIVPFILIMLGAKPVLNILFGDLWNMAAYFIILMAPFYYVKFIVSPLTFMTYIARRQSYDMKWQIVLCVSSTVAFYLGYILTKNPYVMLLLYGIVQTILYTVSFNYTKKLAKGEFARDV
ncbi:MAG: lipopolysaccharide biosynthesis protein [Oscillospiraceae bacterium]